jgi:enoyl-CoA hydratase
MSFTGNFMDADEALAFGLVNHVVPHEELLPFTRSLAADIAGNDRDGVRQMLATYAEIDADPAGWDIESRAASAWRRTRFTTDSVAARRAAVMERGRTQ